MKTEFSRLFWVDKMRGREQSMTIKASPEECTDIAKRLDIKKLDYLICDFVIRRRDYGFLVEGHLDAGMSLTCVHSLDMMPKELHSSFESHWVWPDKKNTSGLDIHDVELDVDDLTDGKIDLGELAVQYLSLDMDLFPQSHVEPQ